MASVIDWFKKHVEQPVENFVSNDVAAPVAHAASSVGNAAGNVIHAVAQAPQTVENDAAPVVQRVAKPTFNLPQTVNNDVFKPVQRDILKPISSLPQTVNNDVLHPIYRAPQNFVNDVSKPVDNWAIKSPIGRGAEGVGIGALRSAVGTAQGVSGLYDLATPGTGTNRFSKTLNNFAPKIDQTAINEHVNPVLYHGSQAASDALQLAIGSGEAKAAARTAEEVPKVGEIVRTGANVLNRGEQFADEATKSLRTGNFGQRVAGRTVQNIANPKYQAANTAFTALQTGKQASTGQKVTPTGVAENLAVGGIGFPAAGAFTHEAAAPILQKTSQVIQSASKALADNADKLSPGLNNHPAVAQLNDHIQSLQKADDNMASRGLSPNNSARINNRKAQALTVQARNDAIKKIKQGGYIKLPGDNGNLPNPEILPQPTGRLPGEESPGVPITSPDNTKPEVPVGKSSSPATNNIKLSSELSVPEAPRLSPNAERNVFAQNPMVRRPLEYDSTLPGSQMSQEDFKSLVQTAPSEYQLHAYSEPEQGLKPATMLQKSNPNIGSVDLGTSYRAEMPESLSQFRIDNKTGQLPSRSQIDKELSSYGNDIPTDSNETMGHSTYPVEKKAGALDYFRTPDRVLNKIGLGNEAKALRTADHNYRKELPKEIEKIRNWQDRVKAPDASERIFKWLDGQKGAKLSGEELKVGQEMKTELKNWADRLHLPKEGRISNYITHIFDESLIMKEFDPDLEKLIADKVPGSVYDPYTQQRLGKKGYIEDAFKAMEAYTKRGVRKANMDPALEKLSNASQSLDLNSVRYVKQYGDRINMRPAYIDNLLDTSIKQSPFGYRFGNRPTASISRALRQATYRASLGLNFGSAVRNLTQGVNTFAELGTHWTTVGYVKALQSLATHSQELKDVGVLDNSLVEDRVLSASKRALQKADQGLFAFFEAAERINRGAAYFGAKARALKVGKSLDEAIQAGVDAARKTQFTFGRIDTPVALQSDIVKTLTQFQSYNVKQAEFLSEMVKNKEFAKLLRYTGASAVIFITVGKALGYRPTDMLPSAQIGGSPPFKVLGAGKNLITKAITAKDNSNSTRTEQIEKSLGKFGSAIGSATIPGFAQAKKTVGGINAVGKGEVKKGSKKIAVNQSSGNYLKGILFGPYSLNGTPKSQGTVENSINPLKNKQVLQESFGKEFASLPDDNARKQWAQQSQANYDLYQQYLAAKQAFKSPSQQPFGISQQSKQTLDIYNRLTPQGKEKYEQRNNAAEYQLAQAKYEQDKLNGTLTDKEDVQRQKSLAKAKVGSVYPKDVRDLYSLSKSDLYGYLTTTEQGVDKQKLAAQLIAYDKALYNAGLISTLKFKNGIAPASKSGGGSSKSDTAAAAAFKSSLRQLTPLKTVGALPAPNKTSAPTFKTPALKSVYRKQAINTKPKSSLTKVKR